MKIVYIIQQERYARYEVYSNIGLVMAHILQKSLSDSLYFSSEKNDFSKPTKIETVGHLSELKKEIEEAENESGLIVLDHKFKDVIKNDNEYKIYIHKRIINNNFSYKEEIK